TSVAGRRGEVIAPVGGVARRPPCRGGSIPRGGAGLRRRVRHLERRSALVRDLATRGAAEADAVFGAAVHSQEHARAGARVRRHDLYEWLLTGPDLPLDLPLELEGSLRRPPGAGGL